MHFAGLDTPAVRIRAAHLDVLGWQLTRAEEELLASLAGEL